MGGENKYLEITKNLSMFFEVTTSKFIANIPCNIWRVLAEPNSKKYKFYHK